MAKSMIYDSIDSNIYHSMVAIPGILWTDSVAGEQ